MKAKAISLFVSLILVLTLFGNASATTYHAVTVMPYDSTAPVADVIAIGSFSQSGNANGNIFNLEHGTYTLTVTKASYQTITRLISVADGNDPIESYYKLQPIVSGTQPTPNTTQPSTSTTPASSTDVFVKSLDFKEKANPGQTVDFTLKIKNSAAYDAEDVLATIIIEDIDGDDNDEEIEIDFGDIDTDKRTETEKFSFEIPTDAEDDDYAVKVKLEWTEELDAGDKAHEYTQTFDALEVARPKHLVAITAVQADKSSYKAGDTATFAVKVLNNGKNDENVQIKIATDFGSEDATASFELKEGDPVVRHLSFAIPEDADAGKYFATITTTYGSQSATEKLVLTIAAEESTETAIALVEESQRPQEIVPEWFALGIIAIILIAAICWLARDIAAKKPAMAVKATRGRGNV